MARLLIPLALAATIAAGAALGQTAPAVHSATVDNVPISGVAATTPSSAPAAGVDGKTDLLNNFQDATPVMPVLTAPAPPDPKH